MNDENSRLELQAVRLFQNAGGLPSDMELRKGANPPDVVAIGIARTIEVEVRRLYADEGRNGSPQRRQYGLAEAVLARAAALHGQRAHGWYEVRVGFSQNISLLDKRIAQVAEDLVSLVTLEDLAPGQSMEFCAEVHWGPAWPPEVDRFSVVRLEGHGNASWGQLGGGWVGHTTHELLQYGLDEKEHVARGPKDAHGERWVLLCCDGSVESSLLALHQSLPSERFQSSFDRAFVMDHTGRRYLDLSLGS